MKNSTLAAPAAGLALAFLLTACTSIGSDLANDEQLATDREAVQAMVQAARDVYAAHMNTRRPARLVMGSWEHVAEANTDLGSRLGGALRELEDEMMGDSPAAPWLLSPGRIEEIDLRDLLTEEMMESETPKPFGPGVSEVSELVFVVYNKEDRSDCWTVTVFVWLQNGKMEFLASDVVGYANFIDPPQQVLMSVLAEEEQHMKDWNAGEVRKK